MLNKSNIYFTKVVYFYNIPGFSLRKMIIERKYKMHEYGDTFIDIFVTSLSKVLFY